MSRAECPERGLQAELVDDELAALANIARVAWLELLGRAAALQLTIDKVNLPGNVMGLELPEVLAATICGDWSALDLGARYRKARARLRALDGESAPKGKAYASHEDVRDALKVAEPLMTLRGFSDSGQHALPFALTKVLQTWNLYGGEGSTPLLRECIAEEERKYNILTILRRFGQVRQAFVASKNPEAIKYCTETPIVARRRFEQHAVKLEGALASCARLRGVLGLGRRGRRRRSRR